jgi:hypothetical protein
MYLPISASRLGPLDYVLHGYQHSDLDWPLCGGDLLACDVVSPRPFQVCLGPQNEVGREAETADVAPVVLQTARFCKP